MGRQELDIGFNIDFKTHKVASVKCRTRDIATLVGTPPPSHLRVGLRVRYWRSWETPSRQSHVNTQAYQSLEAISHVAYQPTHWDWTVAAGASQDCSD